MLCWLGKYCLLYKLRTDNLLLRGGHGVLVRAKLALADTVAMQLSVRAEDAQVAEIMTTAVA